MRAQRPTIINKTSKRPSIIKCLANHLTVFHSSPITDIVNVVCYESIFCTLREMVVIITSTKAIISKIMMIKMTMRRPGDGWWRRLCFSYRLWSETWRFSCLCCFIVFWGLIIMVIYILLLCVSV